MSSVSGPAIKAYCAHIRDVSLPLWLSDGYLAGKGLFAERLDFQGRVIRDVPHRAMVQSRQIYVYSHAALSGAFPDGGEIALRAMDKLFKTYGDTDGLDHGLSFSVSLGGDIVSSVRDSYTHAFVLLALSTTYRLSGERRFRDAIEAVTRFIENHLIDPRFFGMHDQYPPSRTFKAQNPLMHLLEAYLAVHEAWPEGGFLDRASAIVKHFRNRMWLKDIGVLAEHYGEDWSQPDPTSPGAFFEPGHQFEWAWLLRWYGALSGTDQDAIANTLWTSACRHGLKDGRYCYDEISLLMAVRKSSHRLWPHTEGAKIAASRAQAGLADGLPLAEKLVSTLNDTFLHRPFEGGWIDRVDANGASLVDFVPASSLYHVYTAAAALAPLTSSGPRKEDNKRDFGVF